MTIPSIRNRDFRQEDFQPEEVDAMRRDASTSETLNKVRYDAGLRSPAVGVRGDDKTNAELKKEWEAHDIPMAGGHVAAEQIFAIAEGTILEIGSPLLMAVGFGYELHETEKRADALRTNNERGAMHLAMLTALELPQGFKNVEVGKWKDSGTGFQSGAVKLGTTLETRDKKEAALLQLHADRGMNAAKSLGDAKVVTRDGDLEQAKRALDANPQLRAKYDADAAFRAGFDAVVWSLRNDQAAYDDTIAKLGARDARYAQHQIALRG